MSGRPFIGDIRPDAHTPAVLGPGGGGGGAFISPAQASLLALQGSAGNAAVGRLLNREPADTMSTLPVDDPFAAFKPPHPKNMSVPGDDPLAQLEEMEREETAKFVPFAPHEGDPIPGFSTPRQEYSASDRNEMNKQVGLRMVAHNENVQHFENVFCQALVQMWGKHLTAEMEKAARPKDMPLWASITKFIGETALTALVPGLGLFAKEILGVASRTALFLGEHMAGYAIDQMGNAVEGDITSGDATRRVAATRKKLDAQTGMVANLIQGMHERMGPALNIQWNEYGEYIFTAKAADLAQLKLPRAFPRIEPPDIETGVAGAVVAGLHELPHEHETPDHIDFDPSTGDQLRFFDDNQVIAHVRAGLGHEVTAAEAQVYAAPAFLDKLVGKALGGMGAIPLIVPVEPVSGAADFSAALEIVWAIEEAERVRSGAPPPAPVPEDDHSIVEDPERRVSRPREEGDPEPGNEPFPWPWGPNAGKVTLPPRAPDAPKPAHERARELVGTALMFSSGKMSINRGSGGVTVHGGGLAERLWLYRWSHGDDLSGLANRMIDEYLSWGQGFGGVKLPYRPLETSTIGTLLPSHLEPAQVPGAEKLIAEHLNKLAVAKGDDRWDEDYFDKAGRGLGRRKQF